MKSYGRFLYKNEFDFSWIRCCDAGVEGVYADSINKKFETGNFGKITTEKKK